MLDPPEVRFGAFARLKCNSVFVLQEVRVPRQLALVLELGSMARGLKRFARHGLLAKHEKNGLISN